MRFRRWLLVTAAIGVIVAAVLVARHDEPSRRVATTRSPAKPSTSTSSTTAATASDGSTTTTSLQATTTSPPSSDDTTVPIEPPTTEEPTTTTSPPVLGDDPLLFQRGSSLYAINPDGTAQTLLFEMNPSRESYSRFFRWSPDHQRLAYQHDCCIVVRDRDGTNERQLAIGGVGEPAWSPDGQRLAYHCQNDNGATGICAIGVDGTGQVHLTPDECCNADSPDWSPDGTKIVFRRQHENASQSIAVLELTTGTVNDVYGRDPVNYIVLTPQWSPTADLIAFETLSANSFPNYDLWVVDSSGQHARALVTAPKSVGYPRWSPDGQRLAFLPAISETALVWIVNRDGTGGAPVPGLPRDPSAYFDDW